MELNLKTQQNKLISFIPRFVNVFSFLFCATDSCQ